MSIVAKKILLGILIFSLIFAGLAPFVLSYTFKGTIGEMDMAGYETFYRTFYSNHSNRYYMIFDYYDQFIMDWSIVYSHSPFGYTFNPAHTLWNTSSGQPDWGTGVHNRNFVFYLEPNGKYLHTAYINATDDAWYWKFEINASTGQIYPVTSIPQQILDGGGWGAGSAEIRDEISIVADSEGYPFVGGETFDGVFNTYYVWECPNNNGTWDLETFTVHSIETEYINNGHGNPPNDMWGGSLLPGNGKDVILVFWYRSTGAIQELHRSMIWDESASDWIDAGGSIFNDVEAGDWADYCFSYGYNVQANLSVILKQHENNPDGQIGLEAIILNYSNAYTWGSNFQVSFDEVGDAGAIVFNPFASINDQGAINFIWYKTGNVTIWQNRMYPNGTMEGYQVLEDSEFALEDFQFSIIPGMVGDDKPLGIMWMDDIGTLQVGDLIYYCTELLFLESGFSLPSFHLNTTLTGPNGEPIGTSGYDNWIFEGEVYDLVSYVENATSFYVNTTDSRHDIRFNWDNSTSEMWISVDPRDQFTIGLVHSEYERTGNVTRLLWRFIPDRSIIDCVNESWAYFIENEDMFFEVYGDLDLETNIYNLGGLTSYTFTGDGGRIAGGHPFEIYATNGSDGSSARAEQIYRKLQHIHFLIEIDMDNEWEGGNYFDIDPGVGWVDIGIDYRLNATWVEGFSVRLYVQDADVGHHAGANDHNWIEWSVDWYNYDLGSGQTQNFRSDLIYSNHWGYENENLDPDYHNRTSSQLWVDLWFDRTNASTTVSGQVNAMYHGMREHGSAWWFGYGVFQPMISDYGNALMLDDLYDEGGNVTDSMKYDLMRVYVEVGKVDIVDGNDETWTIRAIENYNRKQADDRMQGIEQPAFEETLVLDMPMFQSMNPLIRAIDGISVSIWKGALGFQKILWGAMDSFFAWAGFGEGFFSQITAYLMLLPEIFTTLMDNMGFAVSYLITMIDVGIRMVVMFLPQLVTGMSWVSGSVIDYWNTFIGFLNGGLVDFSLIYDLQLGVWASAGFTMLPLWEMLIIMDSADPMKKAKERLGFYTGIFNGVVNFLKGLVGFMQGIVSTILDILPG